MKNQITPLISGAVKNRISLLSEITSPSRLANGALVAATIIAGAALATIFHASSKKPRRQPSRALKTRLGAAMKPQNGKPVVPLPGNGQLLHQASRNFGSALRPYQFFNLNGQVAVVDSTTGLLRIPTPGEFAELVEEFVVPVKFKNDGSAQPQSVSASMAATIMGSRYFLNELPLVTRCADLSLPIFRDGDLLLPVPGYDVRTCIYTAGSVRYDPNISVQQARTFFSDLLGQFPFADGDASVSGVIAAALTLFCCHLWPEGTNCPAFFYSANLPGAGKTLLASLAMMAVWGHVPATARAMDADETRKMLHSVALERRPVIFLDNVTGYFASEPLELFLTNSIISGRILGRSKTVAASKSTIVMLTGNDCELGPDMRRRTITIRLLVPEKDTRTITTHLDAERLRDLRPQILGALYALVREWAVKGCPKPSRVHHGFPRWSAVVGGILEASGYSLPY